MMHDASAAAAAAGAHAAHPEAAADFGSAMHGLVVSTSPAIADIATSPGIALAADAAASLANDAAHASVLALATWASERLASAESIDPVSVASMQGSVQDLMSSMHGVLEARASTAALGWTNALVLGVQQLVTTLRVAGSGGSTIESMAAAQQAMQSVLVVRRRAAGGGK